MNTRSILLVMSLAFSVPFAGAQTAGNIAARQADTLNERSSMAEGEVRKVDKNAKKITLKHGEIKNLGMPPMTMVFRVGNEAFLDGVKPGDKVIFAAEDVNGAYTITAIERRE